MAETCRQRLMREHPEEVCITWLGGCNGCPDHYGYLSPMSPCGGPYDARLDNEDRCTECWDRVIPESIEEKEKKMMTTKKTKAELLEEIAELQAELKKVEKYRKYDEAAEEIKAAYDAFVRAGFTEEQAFTLFNSMIKASIG